MRTMMAVVLLAFGCGGDASTCGEFCVMLFTCGGVWHAKDGTEASVVVCSQECSSYRTDPKMAYMLEHCDNGMSCRQFAACVGDGATK